MRLRAVARAQRSIGVCVCVCARASYSRGEGYVVFMVLPGRLSGRVSLSLASLFSLPPSLAHATPFSSLVTPYFASLALRAVHARRPRFVSFRRKSRNERPCKTRARDCPLVSSDATNNEKSRESETIYDFYSMLLFFLLNRLDHESHLEGNFFSIAPSANRTELTFAAILRSLAFRAIKSLNSRPREIKSLTILRPRILTNDKIR